MLVEKQSNKKKKVIMMGLTKINIEWYLIKQYLKYILN